MNTHGESIWKLCLLVLVLVFFLCIGIGHVLYPDYFLKRSAMRKGGEMLTDWNRGSFQFIGLLVTGFIIYLMYQLARDIFVR